MNLNLYIFFTADNTDCLFESNNIEIFNIDDSIAMQGRKKSSGRTLRQWKNRPLTWNTPQFYFNLDNT